MSQVLYEVRNGIGYITLNRPDKLNTLSYELLGGFQDALNRAENDEQVKVLVLSGAGNAFSAGGDLAMMQELGDINEIYAWMKEVSLLTKKIRGLSKHIVAAVHGYAAGAGFSMALAADYIVADADAKFVLSFSKVGLIPDMGLFQLLLERVPINIVKEWISFVPALTASELLQRGVINKVVSGSILDEATNFIQPLTEASPLSLLYSKQIMNHMNQSSLDESILQENVHQTMLLKSLDHKEGVNAFYEKRKPSFFGK